MKILSLALVLLLAAEIACIAKAPLPFCSSKNILKQFPLTIDEVISTDLSDIFTGYNLNITIPSNNSFARITPKWSVLDRRDSYFPGIISHFVEMRDNTVGTDSFLLYKDLTGAVHFTYGVIKTKNSLPEINSTALITTDKNVQCYDAALFLDHGLAIIDCAKTND